MDIALGLLNQVFQTLGYALLGAVAYKLFQIGADIGEIKTLLQKSARNASFAPPVASSSPGAVSAELPAANDDSAAEYAEKLLRSLHAESARSESEARKML